MKDHPGYRLRVSDFHVLIDWNKDNEVLYAIEAFERKNTANSANTVKSGDPGEMMSK